MIKHYCDWCKEEVKDDGHLTDHVMLFPRLVQTYFCSEPVGPLFIEGKQINYILCNRCAEKIWRLRNDRDKA